MKTKAIVAALLVAAASSADARFAWPYPPKAVSPDEIGLSVVINGNAWSHDVESEPTTAKNRREVRGKFPTPRDDLQCPARKTSRKQFTFSEILAFERLRKVA
jgi:hypothetical protein